MRIADEMYLVAGSRASDQEASKCSNRLHVTAIARVPFEMVPNSFFPVDVLWSTDASLLFRDLCPEGPGCFAGTHVTHSHSSLSLC